jgi:hypothetical protein
MTVLAVKARELWISFNFLELYARRWQACATFNRALFRVMRIRQRSRVIMSRTIPPELKRSDLPRAQRPRCAATTKSGEPCKAQALKTGFCAVHSDIEELAPEPKAADPKPRLARTKQQQAAAAGPANSYLYSEAVADELCARLAKGHGLKPACRAVGVDTATVMKWATDTKHPFSERYKNARVIGYLMMAEEILEISDNSAGDFSTDENGNQVTNHENIQRSRLKVDSRKWIVARMLPHIYGDRVVTEHIGPNGGAIQVDVKNQVNIFFEKLDAIRRRQEEMRAIEAETEAEQEKRR